ncbi:MAG TPA: VOC family protein [Chloroflexota bacterium]|nr:VOC family protein [Chloroflexota bacterium]
MSTLDSRLRSVVFDCAHPAALARFWAAVLGFTLRPYDDAELARLRSLGLTPETDPNVVLDPPGPGPTIWFNRVPEPKAGKNRVHIDIKLDGLEDVERLVSLGARILRPPDGARREEWFIMADPEGNEFCAFLQ